MPLSKQSVWSKIKERVRVMFSFKFPELAAICVSSAYRVCLQRSRSAFSLTSDDSPEKDPEEAGAGAGGGLQDYTSLKREGKATSLPSWKSVDRLDNSSKNHTDRLCSVSLGSFILT